MDLKSWIREVPDFPKPGILFKDITPLLKNHQALDEAVSLLVQRSSSLNPTIVAGIESRGFIFGTGVALRLGLGFVPVRKPGKLPWKTIKEEYALEYGTDAVEIHEDAVQKGDRVLVIDDLLATGGTMLATCKLIERLGAEVVGCFFVIELKDLKGREKLSKWEVQALVAY